MIRPLAGEIREASPFYAEVLARFDEGTAVADRALEEQLWRIIRELPTELEGRFRLLVGLVRPDVALDWEFAHWVIYWAEEAGAPHAAIRRAFGV